MQKINVFSVGMVGAVLAGIAFAAPVFAAGVVLQNAGLSQASGDNANFSLAVCNKGSMDLTGTVSLAVSANGISANPSVGPIAAGACAFTKLSYASFNMVAGQNYQVSVNIAPNTAATYSVTVPGKVLGASTVNAAAERQSMIAQLAYLESVLKGLQALVAQLHF